MIQNNNAVSRIGGDDFAAQMVNRYACPGPSLVV